jgi:hypothetical protein
MRYRGKEALLDAQHGVGSSSFFASLRRGSPDAPLVRDGGECTGEGSPYLVRLQDTEKPLFWRVTSSEIRRGLVGTAKRVRRAAPEEEGGDLLPRVYLRSGL